MRMYPLAYLKNTEKWVSSWERKTEKYWKGKSTDTDG